VSGFDLLDPDRGIFVSAHSGRGAVIFEGEAVLAAGPASAALGEELRTLSLADGVSLGVEIEPSEPSARIGGERIPEEILTLSRASGTLRRQDEVIELSCPAIGVDSVAEGSPGLALRSIAVVLADGALLAVAAITPPGAEGHGDEEIAGVLAEPERPPEGEGEDGPKASQEIRFAEVLLSTQYGSEGRQQRATLELWPESDSGEPPMRGAGTVICATTVEGDGRRIDTAFFRWSIEGRPGLGRYEIVSPA
jgi:hypothetical protein